MAGEKEEEADNASKLHIEAGSSVKAGQALKPKPKIGKKSLHDNLTKPNEFKRRKRGRRGGKNKKKSAPESKVEKNSIGMEEEKKHSFSEMKHINITNHKEKSQQSHETQKKLRGLQTKKENQINNDGNRSGPRKLKNTKNKEKYSESDKMNPLEGKKTEKLGGLIFMCSAKTKPDCFHYRVMGVPMSKKDLVLCVKPGLKLFLYDFELRVMYGIYRASSSGGMKLEPTAFNGAFPVQVRFTVHQDCYPLPENVFREAIKDNYNEKQKFETKLTVKEVKKLIELFRPVEPVSEPLVIHPQPMVIIPNSNAIERASHHPYNLRPEENQHMISYREAPLAEKVDILQDTFLTENEYRTYGLRRQTDAHTYDEVRRYHVLPREDNRHISYKEALLTENKDLLQNSFLTENEYRTYGLRGEIPNPIPPTNHARDPSAIYGEIAHQRGEPRSHHLPLMNEREYPTYIVAGTKRELQPSIPTIPPAVGSSLDSYPRYQHYYSSNSGTLSMDPPYARLQRRDEIPLGGSYSRIGNRESYPVETDHLPRREIHLTETDYLSRRGSYPMDTHLLRRENDGMERLYSTHASSALSDYNRNLNYTGQGREPSRAPIRQSSHAPVSSRYNFGGPSLSYQ